MIDGSPTRCPTGIHHWVIECDYIHEVEVTIYDSYKSVIETHDNIEDKFVDIIFLCMYEQA